MMLIWNDCILFERTTAHSASSKAQDRMLDVHFTGRCCRAMHWTANASSVLTIADRWQLQTPRQRTKRQCDRFGRRCTCRTNATCQWIGLSLPERCCPGGAFDQRLAPADSKVARILSRCLADGSRCAASQPACYSAFKRKDINTSAT